MMLASGTSTPTSITVVATRRRVRPAAKSASAASRTSMSSSPWARPTWPGKRSDRVAKRSTAATLSSCSEPVMARTTQ
jgi:hypothetical protein